MREAVELVIDPPPNFDWDSFFSTTPRWILQSIVLYNRCAIFREIRLPSSGGILDQPELIMQILETIYSVESMKRDEKKEFQETQAKQRMRVLESLNRRKSGRKRVVS